MKTNQKGFTVIEGLLLALIVGAVGFVGWYVYKSRDTASQSQTSPTVQQTKKEPDCTTLKTDDIVKTKYFCFITPNKFWQKEYAEREVIAKLAPSDQFSFTRPNRGDAFFDASKQQWFHYDYEDQTNKVYIDAKDEGDLRAIHEVNGTKFYEFSGNGAFYCGYRILLFENEEMMTQMYLPNSCDAEASSDSDAPEPNTDYLTEDLDEDIQSVLNSFRFF